MGSNFTCDQTGGASASKGAGEVAAEPCRRPRRHGSSAVGLRPGVLARRIPHPHRRPRTSACAGGCPGSGRPAPGASATRIPCEIVSRKSLRTALLKVAMDFSPRTRRRPTAASGARRSSSASTRRATSRRAAPYSTTGSGGPDSTSAFSSSATSESIRLIFGRIDRSRRVLEAQEKVPRQNRRIRSH